MTVHDPLTMFGGAHFENTAGDPSTLTTGVCSPRVCAWRSGVVSTRTALCTIEELEGIITIASAVAALFSEPFNHPEVWDTITGRVVNCPLD